MTRTAWLLCLGLVAAAFAASGVVYVNRHAWLPESVPVHWGVDFQPDAWAPRDGMFWYLMAPPLGMAACAILLPLLIYWLSPKGFEPSQGNPKVANYIVLLVLMLFAALHAVILLQYVGLGLPGPQAIMGVVFLFFILLGNVLGQVQRNFWIGIRTPWTLANHVVWEKTHRLGAWLFVAAGVLGLVSLFLTSVVPMPVLIGVWIGLFATAALVPVIYSLVLYKRMQRAGKFDEPALTSDIGAKEVHHV
jgi:uncharacterized membrane protein